MKWTGRFGAVLGLCVLFFMVFAGWLGLLPDAASNLVADAAVLTLIGIYAARVGAVGIGLGLFLTLFVVNADQATIALGIPPNRAGTPPTFWLTNILPAALVWLAYPILSRLLTRRLPLLLWGPAIGISLLTLPALRWFNQPELLLEVYLDPRAGTFAILPVPWPYLVGLVTLFATVAVLLTRSPAPSLRRAALGILIMAAILPPASDAITSQIRLRTGAEVEPSHGGPLTPVVVRALVGTADATVVLWDARPVTTSAYLDPLRPIVFGGVTRVDLLPALQAADPGSHEIDLRAGTDRRTALYQLDPPSPGGLQVALEAGHIVVSGGKPHSRLEVLTIGPLGPELLHRRLDAKGSWHSPRAVDDAVALRVIVQSGDAWAVVSRAH